MSASYWAVCPRCWDEAKAAKIRRTEEAAAAYGKVPRDEWLVLEAKAEMQVEADHYRTFREDYEIYGAETGTLMIEYGGSCEVCHLSTEFQAEKQFFPEAAS